MASDATARAVDEVMAQYLADWGILGPRLGASILRQALGDAGFWLIRPDDHLLGIPTDVDPGDPGSSIAFLPTPAGTHALVPVEGGGS